nr:MULTISPECIES: hypothetical protein [Enterobacterales]ALV81835.1 hypothetical protein AOY08_100120 [Providencia rettgeri]
MAVPVISAVVADTEKAMPTVMSCGQTSIVLVSWLKKKSRGLSVKQLSNAQIYTLRRLSSGASYKLRGDGKKALECRPCIRTRFGTNDISAPSIPVLLRLGLVAYACEGEKSRTTFYPVKLTDAGESAAKTMQIRD